MKRKNVSVSTEHVLSALEGYLKALSMIQDNDRVISFNPQNDPITDKPILLITTIKESEYEETV